MNVKALFIAHWRWSKRQFGDEHQRGPEGPLAHLKKEILESEADPTNMEEIVDLQFLVWDMVHRNGVSFHEFCVNLNDKFEVLKGREWQKPNADGSVEHVREE